MNKFSAFLSKPVTIKIPFWLLLLLPAIAYAGWEIYWVSKVGLSAVKWHTHVSQYVYVWLAGFFLFRILGGKKFSEKTEKRLLFFTSVVVTLGVLEIFLQVTGTYKTRMEEVMGNYASPYIPLVKTWHYSWGSAKGEHWLTKPEYAYWRPTNSFGFADEEWRISKKPKEKRIMALGDSFTEGDGTPYDSNYVVLLRTRLLNKTDSFDVMNAGTCGSDPFYNYINLRDCLLIFKPDIVIQMLASSDIASDIRIRGGMDRFQKDGTVEFRPGPWWEPLYAFSYISRLYFRMEGYDELLIKNELTSEEEKRLNEQAGGLFNEYAALCRRNNIRLIVVLRPDKGEIEANKYVYDFSSVLNPLKADTTVQIVDLLPGYRSYIEKRHTTAAGYFWKQDGHHNSTGYEMMAQVVYENISPLLKDTLTGPGLARR